LSVFFNITKMPFYWKEQDIDILWQHWHIQIHNQKSHLLSLPLYPAISGYLAKFAYLIITFLVHLKWQLIRLVWPHHRHFGSTSFCQSMNHSSTNLARYRSKARQKRTIRYKYWAHKNNISPYTNKVLNLAIYHFLEPPACYM